MIDEVAARNDHDRAAVADRVELEALGLPVAGRELEVARAIDRLSTTIDRAERSRAQLDDEITALEDELAKVEATRGTRADDLAQLGHVIDVARAMRRDLAAWLEARR